jgi:hypothetical protein
MVQGGYRHAQASQAAGWLSKSDRNAPGRLREDVAPHHEMPSKNMDPAGERIEASYQQSLFDAGCLVLF